MSNGQIDPVIYAESITSEELKGLLYTYASDYFSGRDTGTKGQKIAVDFLRDYYVSHNIVPAENTDNYFQKMILKIKNDKVETENVVAIIPGNEKPEEYIIISAHLDHVGKNDDGEIFNGADDDGSGTVAILEIDSFSPCYRRRKRITWFEILHRKSTVFSQKYCCQPKC